MKIHVSRVPAEGLRGHATYDPSTMDMERDDIHLDQPFEADVVINKADRELVVDANIRCTVRLSCARCLEDFNSALKAKALFSYAVQPTDVIDITEDVRQEVILAYPMIPICRPGCKGLCQLCGQNLNTVMCSHAVSER